SAAMFATAKEKPRPPVSEAEGDDRSSFLSQQSNSHQGDWFQQTVAVTGGGTYDEVTARAHLRAEIPAGELLTGNGGRRGAKESAGRAGLSSCFDRAGSSPGCPRSLTRVS